MGEEPSEHTSIIGAAPIVKARPIKVGPKRDEKSSGWMNVLMQEAIIIPRNIQRKIMRDSEQAVCIVFNDASGPQLNVLKLPFACCQNLKSVGRLLRLGFMGK